MVNQLKTADKIFEELYNIAKEKFGLVNITPSKSGVIGYILYALAYLQEDAKRYFDFLYSESIPTTAKTIPALLKWAKLFGYPVIFATPAEFIGIIKIYVPVYIIENSEDSEIKIQIPDGTKFIYNDIVFTLVDTDLTVKYNKSNGFVVGIYYDKTSNTYTTKYGGVIESTGQHVCIGIPAYNIYQLERLTYELTVPFYNYGTTYKIPIDFYDSNKYQISNIRVYIKLPNETEYKAAKIDSLRYIYTPNDLVVFINQTDLNKYELVLPDGNYGMYLPSGTELKIILDLTLGSGGNISQGLVLQNTLDTNIYIDNEIITDSNTVQLYSTQNLTSGKDVKNFEEIKTEVIKLIRTNNTLITKQDYIDFGNLSDEDLYFYNVVGFPGADTILFVPIKLDNNLPVKSTTLTLEESQFNPSDEDLVVYPTYIYVMKAKETTTQYIVQNDYLAGSDTIQLDTVSDLNIGDTLLINGSEYTIVDIDETDKTITIDPPLRNNLVNRTQIYKYENRKIELISPFIYVKDRLRNKYKGYMIDKSSFTVNIINVNNNYNTDLSPSVIFEINNFYYDNSDGNYYFSINAVISNNANLEYSPLIKIKTPSGSVHELNKNNGYSTNIPVKELLTGDTDSLTALQASDIMKNINLEFDVYNGTTGEFIFGGSLNTAYLKDVSDSINLQILNNPKDSSNPLITFIPFISKGDFDNFKDVITSTLSSLLNGLNQNITRLVGKETKLTFPNTIELREPEYFLTPQSDSKNCSIDYLEFPISLKIKISKSKDAVITEDDILSIKSELAKYLLSKQGYKINLPQSDIINIVKKSVSNPSSIFDVKVEYPAVSLYSNVSFEYDWLKSQIDKGNKLAPLQYSPPYFNFNIDNIKIIIV